MNYEKPTCKHGNIMQHEILPKHFTSSAYWCSGPVIATPKKCSECNHYTHTMMCRSNTGTGTGEEYKSCGCLHGAKSDTLLNFVIDKMVQGDFHVINELLELQTYALDAAPVSFGDQELACVHNILALTIRYRDRLPNREGLIVSYHRAVNRNEGIVAVDNAVANLSDLSPKLQDRIQWSLAKWNSRRTKVSDLRETIREVCFDHSCSSHTADAVLDVVTAHMTVTGMDTSEALKTFYDDIHGDEYIAEDSASMKVALEAFVARKLKAETT